MILLVLPVLPTEDAPIAKQGVLGLSDWGFSRDGNVSLRGDYEFYWEQLLDYQDIMAETPDTFMFVPSPWVGANVEGEILSGQGYATYSEPTFSSITAI